MKKAIFSLVLVATALSVHADDVMTKQSDGTYVVRTTTICNACGFRKTTPVEVHIKGNKVQKVVPLKNEESANYFAKVKKFLLPIYDNLKVSKAKKLAAQTQVDGCTGATFSTKAVQKNIQAALDYYAKHK